MRRLGTLAFLVIAASSAACATTASKTQLPDALSVCDVEARKSELLDTEFVVDAAVSIGQHGTYATAEACPDATVWVGISASDQGAADEIRASFNYFIWNGPTHRYQVRAVMADQVLWGTSDVQPRFRLDVLKVIPDPD